MNKTERDALISLARRRAKVAVAESEAVAAERLADFEAQMDARYSFDSDDVWAAATAAAKDAVDKAQAIIRARCRELGIPDQCAPSIVVEWYEAGRNLAQEERAEMRRVAKTRIEALRVAAVSAVHRANVEYETTLVAGMMESEGARLALEAMPSVDAMMPMLKADDVLRITQEKQRRRRI